MSKEALHRYESFVSFGDTDASGRIYFANIYNLAHRAIEDFAMKNNFYDLWFANKDWATPVRHSQADYLSELNSGSPVSIDVYLEKVGNSSFTWRYEVLSNGKPAAIIKITHVTVDLKTKRPIPVPESLKGLAK